jgi:hypothetical protein
VPEEDHLLVLVLLARVLDEPRQLPEVAGEDLRSLAGQRRGVAVVVLGSEQGVIVTVPDPFELVPEDPEARGPAFRACRAMRSVVSIV